MKKLTHVADGPSQPGLRKMWECLVRPKYARACATILALHNLCGRTWAWAMAASVVCAMYKLVSTQVFIFTLCVTGHQLVPE